MTVGEAPIVVERISHVYAPGSGESVHSLDEVSLSLAEGEFVCVLGPSGCGKSTLLMIVAGLLRPTAGRVLLDGAEVRGPGPDRGVVFQEYALLPWKDVLDNVGLGLKFRGMGRRERDAIAQRHVDLVNLTGFEQKFPHELSGGMRQRAAVARTLAADPRVVLMDEPFSAVDSQSRMTLQEELVSIWQATRKTILFVTHSIEEAAFLADRVVIMSPRPGRIAEIFTIATPRTERRGENPSGSHSEEIAHLLGVIRASSLARSEVVDE